jgi:diguanylate cyclase (GGDEF)-like protein
MLGVAAQYGLVSTAVIGAIVLAGFLGLRALNDFEGADRARVEQIRQGPNPGAHFDAEVARLQTEGRLALSGSVLTLFMLVVGLIGYSMRERRRNAYLVSRVDALVRTDGETGAANRRTWEERLAHELLQSRRLGYPITIAMVEIDRFKAFTELQGRIAGDQLLGALAQNWTAILRKGDLMGRFGGEQFALLLPGCPSDQAEALLMRLRRLVPSEQTISAGVATWHWRESAEMLLERTFEALNGAKAIGGNRVALSQSAPPNIDRPAHQRVARVEAVIEDAAA